jgi:hypothetical protein
MDIIKNKILVLINQEFMRNHIQNKIDLENITTRDDLRIWINNNRHLFNIYFKNDLDKILTDL